MRSTKRNYGLLRNAPHVCDQSSTALGSKPHKLCGHAQSISYQYEFIRFYLSRLILVIDPKEFIHSCMHSCAVILDLSCKDQGNLTVGVFSNCDDVQKIFTTDLSVPNIVIYLLLFLVLLCSIHK